MKSNLKTKALLLLVLPCAATLASGYVPHAEALKEYQEDFFDAMSRGYDAPGTAVLVRGGAEAEAGAFAALFARARAGDVIRLSAGTHDACAAEQGGGPLRVEGAGYLATLLACPDPARKGAFARAVLKLKDVELSDLAIVNPDVAVGRGARAWLIGVRTVGKENVVTESGDEDLKPRHSHLARLWGSIGRGGDFMQRLEPTFGTVAGRWSHSKDVMERRKFGGERAGDFEDFAEEAADRAYRGKDLPSKRKAEAALAWLDAAQGVLPCCNLKSQYDNTPQRAVFYREMLERASAWLERRYALKSKTPSSAPAPANPELAAAKAAAQKGYALSALLRLHRLPPALASASRAEVGAAKDAAQSSLGDYACTPEVLIENVSRPHVAGLGRDAVDKYVLNMKKAVAADLAKQVGKRYPLLLVAPARGNACRIEYHVHSDGYQARKTVAAVKSNVTYEMRETEASLRRRQEAARAAMNAELDSALSKMSANSERVRDMWRKTYDHRTRLESSAGGLTLVSWTGDESGRASAATVAAGAAADRRAAEARASAGGREMEQVEHRDDLETFHYFKRHDINATLRVRSGGKVVAELGPLDWRYEWSQGPCTSRVKQHAGGVRAEVEWDCLADGGTGGYDDFNAKQAVPFLEAYLGERWLPGVLARVSSLASSNEPEARAEAALLTMAMGATLSPQRRERLSADLGMPDAAEAFRLYLWGLQNN